MLRHSKLAWIHRLQPRDRNDLRQQAPWREFRDHSPHRQLFDSLADDEYCYKPNRSRAVIFSMFDSFWRGPKMCLGPASEDRSLKACRRSCRLKMRALPLDGGAAGTCSTVAPTGYCEHFCIDRIKHNECDFEMMRCRICLETDPLSYVLQINHVRHPEVVAKMTEM